VLTTTSVLLDANAATITQDVLKCNPNPNPNHHAGTCSSVLRRNPSWGPPVRAPPPPRAGCASATRRVETRHSCKRSSVSFGRKRLTGRSVALLSLSSQPPR
jgi:hypothetical protein